MCHPPADTAQVTGLIRGVGRTCTSVVDAAAHQTLLLQMQMQHAAAGTQRTTSPSSSARVAQLRHGTGTELTASLAAPRLTACRPHLERAAHKRLYLAQVCVIVEVYIAQCAPHMQPHARPLCLAGQERVEHAHAQLGAVDRSSDQQLQTLTSFVLVCALQIAIAYHLKHGSHALLGARRNEARTHRVTVHTLRTSCLASSWVNALSTAALFIARSGS